MQSDLVSIIVPCFNQGKYLSEALDSVLYQTHTNWECIIVNDGSTDDTEHIALNYRDIDNRFKYIARPNGGISVARNDGLKEAKGEYIKFLDADDWIDNQSIEKSLFHSINFDLIITQTQSYADDTKKFTDYYCNIKEVDLFFENILLNFSVCFDIPIHSALISSKLLTTFKFNEELHIGEDWIMWLSIFRQAPNTFVIDEPLAFYRKWHRSATTNINKTLINQFYAYQYVAEQFNLNKEITKKLNDRILKKMMDKIDFLEKSNAHLRNSTSFKLGFFFVNKFNWILNILSITTR